MAEDIEKNKMEERERREQEQQTVKGKFIQNVTENITKGYHKQNTKNV